LRRRLFGTVALFVAVLVFGACGGSETSLAPEGARGTGEGTAYEPVTVENCGIEQTFERPPERAVTMNQHATEVMLALGLEERMVGMAYLDDEILPEFQEEYESVPVLSEQYPSREELLGVEPDFVFGGFTSAFEPEAAGTREDLHGLGIGTYLMTEYCPNAGGGKASLEQVYEDILNVGRIFGVEDRAERVVGEMKALVRETQSAVSDVEEPLSVAALETTSEGGSAVPFVGGGRGVANEIIELAGARNVYSDVPDQFAESSWEELVARDPDVILIRWCCGSTPEGIREQLLSTPAISEMEAIREERFVQMGLSNLVAGVRNARAIRDLAGQLYPEEFDAAERDG